MDQGIRKRYKWIELFNITASASFVCLRCGIGSTSSPTIPDRPSENGSAVISSSAQKVFAPELLDPSLALAASSTTLNWSGSVKYDT
jgi:hypothetical protein